MNISIILSLEMSPCFMTRVLAPDQIDLWQAHDHETAFLEYGYRFDCLYWL